VVITTAIVAPFAAGYFGPHPEYLTHRLIHIPVLYLTAIVVVSVVAGHGIYQLLRDRFLQARTIEEQSQALAADNAVLEDEVQEKLEEVEHLSARIESVHFEARTDLARALHDDLGQLIVGARLQLGNLEHLLSAEASEKADELQLLYGIVDALSASTKRIVGDLRDPSSADDVVDLEAKIETLIAPIRRSAALEVATSVDVDLELLPQVREAIFRTVQEAMTNVLKHAHARRAEIEVAASRRMVHIQVRDDGRGFEHATDAVRLAGPGFGLVGMRERAESLGGRLELRREDAMTCVEVVIPLGPNSETPGPSSLPSTVDTHE
jgi:signal transduction histidine kinase